jgi:hypothetical protein
LNYFWNLAFPDWLMVWLRMFTAMPFGPFTCLVAERFAIPFHMVPLRRVGAREESEGKANAQRPICLEYPELFILLGLRVVLVVLCVYRDS